MLLSQVPRFTLWTQVERAHCGALLRADQDVAATREGTVWNQLRSVCYCNAVSVRCCARLHQGG